MHRVYLLSKDIIYYSILFIWIAINYSRAVVCAKSSGKTSVCYWSFHSRVNIASSSLWQSVHRPQYSHSASCLHSARMSTVPVSLDRSSFDIEVTHLALKVKPSLCNHYQTEWKNFLFKRPKMRCVYNTPDNKFRLVVLKEEFQDPTLAFAPVSLRDEHLANGDGVELHKIRLGYEHFSVDEVLRRLLPATISEIPSSFEQAGHIAHVNLRDEALPYKKLIGSVIVDKNPNIRTVVNKVGQIETEYRTFPLEVIAGDDDMMVTLKESNASFTFNFAEVYWNSRLQMEHHRLINLIKDRVSRASVSNDTCEKTWIVADVMGGVGPFAVPLAQAALQSHTKEALYKPESASSSSSSSSSTNTISVKKNVHKKVSPGMIIHANDLNPASYKYLVQNLEKNRVQASLVPYNLDGRVFIRDLVGRQGVWPDEAIMNLPQNATDFLDVFIGLGHLYDDYWRRRGRAINNDGKHHKSLRIHVYAFSIHPEDPIGDIVRRSADILQCRPEEITATEGGNESGCIGHVVRDVAPKKLMVCVSFYLPQSVMYNGSRS